MKISKILTTILPAVFLISGGAEGSSGGAICSDPDTCRRACETSFEQYTGKLESTRGYEKVEKSRLADSHWGTKGVSRVNVGPNRTFFDQSCVERASNFKTAAERASGEEKTNYYHACAKANQKAIEGFWISKHNADPEINMPGRGGKKSAIITTDCQPYKEGERIPGKPKRFSGSQDSAWFLTQPVVESRAPVVVSAPDLSVAEEVPTAIATACNPNNYPHADMGDYVLFDADKCTATYKQLCMGGEEAGVCGKWKEAAAMIPVDATLAKKKCDSFLRSMEKGISMAIKSAFADYMGTNNNKKAKPQTANGALSKFVHALSKPCRVN